MDQHITDIAQPRSYPIRMVQFGEGNFLRAFVDHMVDIANERLGFNCGIAIVKPIAAGSLAAFNQQDNLYTVWLRGKQDGQLIDQRRIITAIQCAVDAQVQYEEYKMFAQLDTLDFIVSNTTEAGIVLDLSDRLEDRPPASFPGKLTQFLYTRWLHFNGDPSRGLIVLPVELIEDNGQKLLQCVLQLSQHWQLPCLFIQWIERSCIFCSTLVDRIVTGFPRYDADELYGQIGYKDALLDIAEPFGLWVIQGPPDIAQRLPLDQACLPVIFTDDLRPYRERKVRLLNGAHTATVMAGYLAGLDTVGQCMDDPLIRRLMHTALREEIAPTVPLPQEQVEQFTQSVFQRFENPFIRHELLSICLNSVSKWRARILPSLLDGFHSLHTLPCCLTFSFAALLAFYRCACNEEGHYWGTRGGLPYPVLDQADTLERFALHGTSDAQTYASAIASQVDLWGMDLCMLPGFANMVTAYLQDIDTIGMRKAIAKLFEVSP